MTGPATGDDGSGDDRLLELYAGHPPLTVQLPDREYRLPAVLAVDPCDPAFEGLRLRLDHTPFQPPASIADRIPAVWDELEAGWPGVRSDDTVVRLAALDPAPGVVHGTLQPARYHDALATNFSMDRVPAGYHRSLRQLLARPDHRLPPPGESPLVDHLGVVALVESADGQLVIQHRSAAVANRPDTLSASASGAVRWPEIAAAGPVIGLPALGDAAMREVQAELGVRPLDPLFLGLVRELRRGGKPELYFFARSDASFDEIVRARSDAPERSETLGIEPAPFHSRRADGAERPDFFRDACDTVRRAEKEANLTLIAGVLLAVRRLTT